MNWLFREPRPDPRLGQALRRLEAGSALDDAQLHQRILAAAAPTLGTLRAPAPRWWEWISRWMPIALPVGLAASLAAGLLVPEPEDVASVSGYSSELGADSTLFLAAYSEQPAGGQLAAFLVSPQSGDLFEEAVTQ
jgi:hypothetical protein